jgi:NAD(P)-dependent dehydrogenase (short-subunit alcohol dehydrogenase family)
MTRADDSPVADFANMLRLDGRTYVVIGAGQGMGTPGGACAGAKRRSYRLRRRGRGRANDIATEVGNDAVPWVGDVTKRDGVKRLFADAGKVFGGKLNGFVDIVGMAQYSNLTEITDDLWEWHFDMNLRHGWLAMQYAAPLIKANGGGTMTFVASVSGTSAAPRHAAYGAAKAGLMALVKSAAVELGPDNIRVNASRPAWCGPTGERVPGTRGQGAQLGETRRCVASRRHPTSRRRCCSSRPISPRT